ncbi:hypothetical protein BTVI_155870 [Pitangus sulphuratus]|nr:hypothetical protein BTVI_155870 [Pitangus sulphuratus]
MSYTQVREYPSTNINRVENRVGSSPEEEDLEVLAHELNMIWLCALTASKSTRVLGYIAKSIASRWREGILPLCSDLVRPHLQFCVQLWCPQHRKDTDLLESPEEAMEMIRRLEHLFLRIHAETVGGVKPGEEKALR